MGVQAAGKVEKGHHARVQRGLRAEHHGEEARHVRPEQSRPEGQDATNRLLATGRQGKTVLLTFE